MFEEEKTRLSENVQWFEQFFDDLYTLMAKVKRMMLDEFHFEKNNLYCSGSTRRPYMPSFYGLYLSGKPFSVQILAILSSNMIQNPNLVHEPSFIIVKHSSAEAWNSFQDFSLPVLQNTNPDEVILLENGGFAGQVNIGKYKGTDYKIFQVFFDAFIDNPNISKTIDNEIIKPLKNIKE